MWLGTERAPLPAELTIGDGAYVGVEFFFIVNKNDDIICTGCARRGAAVCTISASELLERVRYRVGDKVDIAVRWQPLEGNALSAVDYSHAELVLEAEPVRRERSIDNIGSGADHFRAVRWLAATGFCVGV